nr:hypothetical protein CFP56_56056 [Quercus suber]
MSARNLSAILSVSYELLNLDRIVGRALTWSSSRQITAEMTRSMFRIVHDHTVRMLACLCWARWASIEIVIPRCAVFHTETLFDNVVSDIVTSAIRSQYCPEREAHEVTVVG